MEGDATRAPERQPSPLRRLPNSFNPRMHMSPTYQERRLRLLLHLERRLQEAQTAFL